LAHSAPAGGPAIQLLAVSAPTSIHEDRTDEENIENAKMEVALP
jgi:hypothetical protein